MNILESLNEFFRKTNLTMFIRTSTEAMNFFPKISSVKLILIRAVDFWREMAETAIFFQSNVIISSFNFKLLKSFKRIAMEMEVPI